MDEKKIFISIFFYFQIQITCFQSVSEGSTQSRKEIEIEIISNNDSLMANNFQVSTKEYKLLQ